MYFLEKGETEIYFEFGQIDQDKSIKIIK